MKFTNSSSLILMKFSIMPMKVDVILMRFSVILMTFYVIKMRLSLNRARFEVSLTKCCVIQLNIILIRLSGQDCFHCLWAILFIKIFPVHDNYLIFGNFRIFRIFSNFVGSFLI